MAPTRKHRPDMLLLLFMGILLLLGLIIIYAISPALIVHGSAGTDDQVQFMLRQALYLGIGLAGFAAMAIIPVDFWRKHKGKLMIAALILGITPFVLQATPIGLCANGACRWIDLGFVSFQPAEFMKFALLIYLAGFLSVRIAQNNLNDMQQTLWPVGAVLLAVAIIVIGLQRDLGTGLTVFSLVLTVLFIAGLRAKYFIGIVIASVAVGAVFTFAAPHRLERIFTFINHDSAQDDADSGYHINQALIAVGSGGLMGKGLGEGIQAFGYLPEAANDSIFPILAEKFGFVGTVAILAIFAGLFMRILFIMEHTADLYYRLIVAGVFGWVFAHTVINICAMLGIFPLTGITLPFVSFGGTSLLFMLCALGLVFQISRYTSHTTPNNANQQGGTTNDDRRRGRGIGRTRHAGSRSFA